MAALLDIVKKGAIDRSVTLRIIDSADGTPETGVVFNTAGIDLWYRREGGARVAITEATLASLTAAHSDGGFLHISDGEYRLDLPDAAVATGANHVDVGGTVTGMVVIGGRIRLVDYDPEDTVRLGLTALPAAAAAAAGGLFTRGSGAGQINQDANGRIDVNVAAYGGAAGTFASGRPEVNTTHWGGTSVATAVILAAANIASNAFTAAKFAAGAFDAVWTVTTRILTAGTNIVLAKGTGVTGFNDLSAAQVNTEVDTGIADAALATAASLATVASNVSALVAAGFTRTGTAQAGAPGSITLDAGASAVDDFYKNQIIVIASGTGAGQARFISGYTGATKVAAVANWATNPNNTSVFYIIPFGAIPGATAPTATEIRQEIDNNSTQLAKLGAPAGATISADIAAVKAQTAAIETDTQDIQNRLPAALVSGRMASDAVAISGSTVAADGVESNIANLDVAVSTRTAGGTYTTPPTAIANADTLLDRANAIEGGITPRGALRAILASTSGQCEPGNTTEFTNPSGTKTRVTATTPDTTGRRTAISLDLTDA
jgi:hypothetical protein